MVNNPIVINENSGGRLAPPKIPRINTFIPSSPLSLTDANRFIANGPIYDLRQVKDLVKIHGIALINDVAQNNVIGIGENSLPPPEWDASDICALINALEITDYNDSQWCNTSTKRVLDCDSYLITYGRNKRARWESGLKIYIKFGYSPNTSTPTALICSIHPAKY